MLPHIGCQTQRASPEKPAKLEAQNGPPNRHPITSTSVSAHASHHHNTAPGGLACCPTSGCISKIVRCFPSASQSAWGCPSRFASARPHQDNTRKIIMTTHARAPCSTLIFWTANLVARCERLCSPVSWRCAAPNRLLFANHSHLPTVLLHDHFAPKNSWLQNAARAVHCAVVARQSLVVSSSSSFTCAQ